MLPKTLLAAAAALSLCACTQTIPYDPVPPRAALMKPPEPLPKVKTGDDIYKHAADVRAAYGREADKLKGLQGYVRTLLKNSKRAKQ